MDNGLAMDVHHPVGNVQPVQVGDEHFSKVSFAEISDQYMKKKISKQKIRGRREKHRNQPYKLVLNKKKGLQALLMRTLTALAPRNPRMGGRHLSGRNGGGGWHLRACQHP